MPNRGKKYIESREAISAGEYDGFEAAVKMTLDSSYAKFDETVDLAVRLGVDPRHADQMVRGSVILPNGTGKEVKVLVFAKGEKEKKHWMQVPNLWEMTTWWRRSRTAGLVLTKQSLPPT